MIEITDDWKYLLKVLKASNESKLNKIGREIESFKPDTKIISRKKREFSCHNVEDVLLRTSSDRTLVFADTGYSRTLSVFVKLPDQKPFAESVLGFTDVGGGKMVGTLRRSRGEQFSIYTFDVSEQGLVRNFKEKEIATSSKGKPSNQGKSKV